MFGVDIQFCRKFIIKQWWFIFWANTVFYLWIYWTSMVYGGKSLGDFNNILCKIWDVLIVDGQVLL